ncbi:MAG: segregation/condensation protein A [Patescibacteria group bacterium]|nr:segregation/condensation protein A [Patescibacteria group bacterium]
MNAEDKSASFVVRTHVFEGPLDLLLELIEKRKLYISDISLAQVTDDFIEHIKRFESIPMAESAHFILIASTLILIKSKSLLPELTLSDEEKGDIRDLEIRLKIYRRIKEASRHIGDMFGAKPIYFRDTVESKIRVFAPDAAFTIASALASLRDIIARLPKQESLPRTIVSRVISLEDMIENLTSRVTKHLRMSFRNFAGEHRGNKVNVIVSFLAMLELVKQGILHVEQNSAFGDINMETKNVGIPTYS